MTIVKALKAFFLKLNGVEPSGDTIADVIRNGAAAVERNNESALATRMTAAETALADSLQAADGGKSFILNSSTADSTKKFKITVVDTGTITATELDENGDPVNP